MNARERRYVTYRVMFAVDRKGRYWQLIELDRMAPHIIGEG